MAMAEQLCGSRHISLREQRPNVSATDDRMSNLDRGDDVQRETLTAADLHQRRNSPAPVATKGEVAADPQLAQ
jgi:hypothetical protein